MNKPLLLLFVAAVVPVTQCGYSRPVQQRYPWTSYTTEPTDSVATKISGEGTPLHKPSSSTDLSDGAETISPLATSEVRDGIHCGYYFRTPCNLAKRRRLHASRLGGTASVSPIGGDDILKTSASEFYFSNSGGEDKRVYGPRPRSYHGYSSFLDSITGQEFNSRSIVLPPHYATPIRSTYGHGGVFPFFFGNIDPGKTLFVYTLSCSSCGKTGDMSTTPQPSVDHKSTWVPKIYRTSTEEMVKAGSTTTENVPETITTEAPEEINNVSFSGGSNDSDENPVSDEKIDATTTELSTATTIIPDFDGLEEAV